MTAPQAQVTETKTPSSALLFFCGDVMLGRGIDQILAHPGDPRLHEPLVHSAIEYVELAEAANGPIPRAVAPDYIWGDALAELAQAKPHARIINLETSVTTSAAYAPKGINYKMNPANVACLTTAGIDCCVLGNNHVLDFGRGGLAETLETLHGAGVKTAGAGRSAAEAQAPAIFNLTASGRLLVFAFGHSSSGIPRSWAAGPDTPGIDLLPDFSERTLTNIARRVSEARQAGDLLVASLHWGGNWGYEIADAECAFAHGLIDGAGFDLIHGHSSHHPKAIEVYHDRLILYGCGDFLNDYEGISGYEEFRGDLSLMYLPRLSATTGRLIELCLVPFRVAQFRLHPASPADTIWLRRKLGTISGPFGVRVEPDADGRLWAHWG
ncbi:MAG TPA: CapA family protein [Stellaceae bacterium]|nr:CapA family protein [Stellaceae bacterium]